MDHGKYNDINFLYRLIESAFMYIFIQLFMLLIMQEQLCAGPFKSQKLDIRFRSIKSARDEKSCKNLEQKKCNPIVHQEQQRVSTLNSVMIDGQKFLQVPAKLIGSKLERYFTESSAAVVVMSCCKNIQVHRTCLRDMFHAVEHQCSDQCPGCCKKVTRAVFAASRPNYLNADQRKQFCDKCHQVLDSRR